MNIELSPVLQSVPARRFETHLAQAYSQIARHGAHMTLALGRGGRPTPLDGRWELLVSAALDGAVRAAANSSALIEWAGSRFRLSLPSAGVRAWLAARMPDLELDELPTPLHAAAVQTLLNEGLEGLRLVGNGPAKVLALDVDSDRASSAVRA